MLLIHDGIAAEQVIVPCDILCGTSGAFKENQMMAIKTHNQGQLSC